MKPQIEEFMVFEDENGKTGVIIESNSEYFSWWKCYKSNDKGGQVFSFNDNNFYKINKLYKTNRDKYFYALKFMANGDLSDYKCVYDATKKLTNVTININIDKSYNVEQILNSIKNEFEKIS
jgi:hypothetical protein